MTYRSPLDKFVITQRFGERPEYYKKYGVLGHMGLDLRTRNLGIGQGFWNDLMGYQNARAVTDGIVTARYGSEGYGNYVDLVDPAGNLFRYAHLKNARPPRPEDVLPPFGSILRYRARRGDVIAVTGNTGDSSAPHLHFGYRPVGFDPNNGFGGFVDPLPLFKRTFRCSVVGGSINDPIVVEAAKFVDAKLKEWSGGMLGFQIVQWVEKSIADPTPGTYFTTDEAVPLLKSLNVSHDETIDYVLVRYSGNSVWTYTVLYDSLWTVPFTIMPQNWTNIADSLLFEVGHGLIQCYNERRGMLPSISNADNYSGGEQYVKAKVEAVMPFLYLYDEPSKK